jgi:predicted amidohydrolase
MSLAAVVQLNSTGDVARNLDRAEALVRRAAAAGAALVATPEHTPFLGASAEKLRLAEPLDGPLCGRFSALARELSLHLLLGSFPETSPHPGKVHNTSVLFGPDGSRLAVYRKIHLFDVALADGFCSRESDTVAPGEEPVTVPTPLGVLGLSICYDLRFGELFGKLRGMGAQLIAVPSAFTAATGKDHWEVLLRARAIETQCYILAPAQAGRHGEDGELRESHGHAMIVDPWGEILASVNGEEGFAVAPVDLGRVAKVRAAMPLDRHRKL